MFGIRKKFFKLILVILCAAIFAGALVVGINKLNPDGLNVSAKSDTTEEASASDDFKTSSVAVAGKSYKLADDSGYKPSGMASNVFGSKPYAEISLFVNGGEIIKGGRKNNNIPAYGYVMGEIVEDKNPSIELRLKYNYNTTTNINGTNWEISDDTWKSTINGISGVGVVGTGAMIVQKSFTGGNDASEWKWDNPFIKDGKTSSFHTTDFTTHYAPEHYDGKPHTWETTKEENGETKTIKHESDGWITIYTPAGEDLNKGVYLKVLLAYEIKYSTTERTWYTLGFGTKTVWHYANVLEETKLYICNSAAKVLYQNLVFDDTSKVEEENEEEASRSEIIRMAGTILDGHATNEGFKLNTNGNVSYTVEYRKDNSLNWITVSDGALFTTPGRYEFRVTPSIGSRKYTTIYINERGIQQNVARYFDNGFITDDSQRIFTDEPIPVYVAGKTWYEVKPVDSLYMPLVGRIRRVSGQEMEKLSEDDERYDKEKGGEQFAAVNVYEDIASLTAEQSRKGWKGKLDKSGEYEVEFANNPNYFEGTVSGDVYHFVFKFKLEDEETAPSLNETLLENNVCYFDYASGYYGVSLRSNGAGNVIYAFPSYSEAYDFAYEYYRSLVKSQDGAYVFQGTRYNTQQEVLGAVTKAADGLVERKYFDPTDKDSYLTVKNAGVNILTQELPRNVVVMADMLSPYDARIGDPFLNDKIYNFIDENGNPDESKVPVRFISIAEFESKTVQLEYEKTDENDLTEFKINIGYGVPVESVLNGKNAPSGRYKITETDKYGNKNEYYAVYIKQGDIRTKLELSRTLNGVAVTNEVLSKANALTRMTANSFVLNSAVNELDPYGIVKIQKLGADGYTKIYELSEVKDIVVDTEGNYKITIADRLGNSAEFFADIYTAKKVYKLTLMNGEEQLAQSLVSGGQKIALPVPENADKNLEFIGWSDGNGNVYNGVMSYNTASDLTLTAVFNYINTSIEIYDGGLVESLTVKPEDKVVLPQVSENGLTLYGFAYTQPDGSVRFYRGQITSVPNVTAMRLDAMWVDYGQTYTQEQPVRDGMIFAGWLYQNDGLSGSILESDEVEDGMTVYSLWLTEEAEEESSENSAAFLGLLGGIGSVGGGLIIAGLAALILALLAYIAVKSQKANTADGKAASAKSHSAAHRRARVATATVFDGYQEDNSLKQSERTVNIKTRLPFRIWLKCHIVAIIACFMGCVFAFSALYKLMLPVSQKLHYDAQIAETTAKIQATLDERNNRKPTEKYLAVANETLPLEEEKSQSAYTEDESFLLANIYLNLISLGYDVFPAQAVKQDGTQVKGFAYCSYDEAYEKDGDKDRLYVGCGFLPIFSEPQITDKDTENGIEIKPILEENEQAPEYGFILSFEETFGPVHYIAYGKYVRYTVKNFSITYTAVKNEPSAYDLEIGYLYDYDLEQPIYDPGTGSENESKYDAYSIIQGIDYEHALNAAQGTISNQDDNFLTVDTMQVTYISKEAISEFLIHNQEESYLGIPAECLQQLESTLKSNLYYYVDENGELQLAEIPPDPEPNIFKIIFAIAQIALGAILIVTGVGVGVGLMMMAGGIISLVSDELSAILGGLGTIGNGLKCLMVGLQCITCFPVGTVVGTVMVATGLATMAFGFNDIVTAMTGRNFIQEITGMSDKAYFWCNLGLNLASTVLSVSASMAKAKGLLCFPAGTGVLAVKANGAIDKVAIEDIQVGDRVMSYNEATGSTEVKTVTQTFTSMHEEVVKVTHSGGQTITSSVGHRYYTQRGWIGAEDLRAGDILQLVNGEKVVVELVQHEILENSQTLYNFEVDGNHNYYVAEDTEINVKDFVLVHNDCPKRYTAKEIEKRFDLPEGTFHRKVKPEIIKQVKQSNKGKLPYYLGDNPDICLNKAGDIFLQHAKNASKRYASDLNINDILKMLRLK